MEIAKQDMAAQMMKSQICAIKKEMRNNYEEIKKVSSQNVFLDDVVDDYNEYYEYMKQQKEQQYEALRTLTNYIDDMSRELKMTEYLLRDTQEDQRELIKEMKNVKRDIGDLMND